MDKPDSERMLAPLKVFQRRTVDYVFKQLYCHGAKRFLVADEVGLGKTLVARGVIALAIEKLWPDLDKLGRIDIVYICSNGDIARQNINRLNVLQDEAESSNHFAFATRLTMLPLILNRMDENPVNFVSFTPGTSFDLRSSGGVGGERALLYQMLNEPWKLSSDETRQKAADVIFRLGVSEENWPGYLDMAARRIQDRGGIDSQLLSSFLSELEASESCRENFDDLADYVTAELDATDLFIQERSRILGEMRRILARVCVKRLEPDLIILDEFQRFKSLLDGEDDAAELAKELFNFSGGRADPRVLLLSATPYQLYSTHADSSTGSHHEDLLRTVEFLLQSKPERDEFKNDLKAYREELFRAAAAGRRVNSVVVQKLESRLRRVMVRTERLGGSGDRSGMLCTIPTLASPLATEDLSQFAIVDSVAQALNLADPVEYWKSTPYALNLMDRRGYRLKERFVDYLEAQVPISAITGALREHREAFIDWAAIENYGPIKAANARLRAMLDLGLPDGASSLLWVPPALPYYRSTNGPFARPELKDYSKILVFSSWLIVPKMISMLIGYEAERQLFARERPSDGRSYTYTQYSERPRLLEFRMSDGRREQMTHMTMLYPCMALASLVDPASLSRQITDDAPPADVDIFTVVLERVRSLIAPHVADHAASDSPEDQRWYWVILGTIDREDEAAGLWLRSRSEKIAWDKMVPSLSEEGNFAAYVDNIRNIVVGPLPDDLGRPPDDLAEVVARTALGSPAVTALRAILRTTGNPSVPAERVHLLAAAARIALGFRSLFNMPMVSAMVRREHSTDERGYWRSVLDYCLGGNLQAVIDEYCHILRESLGLVDREPVIVATELANEISGAVSLRTVNLELDEIVTDDGPIGTALGKRRRSIRCRYAMRFGDGRGERGTDGAEGEQTRKEQVRQAFNSPFWPFVLTTTSVGQEGLDFHQYCRRLVHWNLPGNPVDLEQREGRVHRYKSHAVRWNVASRVTSNGCSAAVADLYDIWKAAFQEAAQSMGDPDELVPYWLVPDARYKIERHVPLYPLSRDHARLEDLQKKLALYRMAFGQPRQEDLLAFLQLRADSPTPNGFEPVFIDLAPRNPGQTASSCLPVPGTDQQPSV